VQREQKTGEPGCPGSGRVEPEGTQGARSTVARESTNGDSAIGQKPGGSLLDAVLDVNNL
jgi:hypothetical protein